MGKTVIFVGGGASSLIGAIELKQAHSDFNVIVLEKNDCLGRKLKASGSGRCNIAPVNSSLDVYYNSEFVKKTIGSISLDRYLFNLSQLGIVTKEVKGVGYYPISESANNVVYILEQKLIKLGVQIVLNCRVLDYAKVNDKYIVKTDKENYETDVVVFANGGSSYPSLGGEDTLSNIFINHGYHFVTQKPVLTPIKVKENIHLLNGVRVNATVSLINNRYPVFKEAGEVQFRKDGLSGIVVFNISRHIDQNEKYSIVLDLLHTNDVSVTEQAFVNISKNNPNHIYSLVNKQIVNFCLSRLDIDSLENCSENDFKSIYRFLCNITFTFKSLFSLEHATVSRGGIDVKQINYDFSSKIEKNIYFLGEIIDVDGPCGGYSLRFAITTGFLFGRFFK